MVDQNMVVNVINEENIKRNKNIFLKKQPKNLGFFRNQQKNSSEKRGELHLIPKVMELVTRNNWNNGEKQVSSSNQRKILLPEKREKIQTGIRRKKKLWLNWGRDIFFQSVWLNKLQNRLMRHGKKGIAEKILVKMLTILNQQGKGNAFLVFHQALNQIRPVLTVIPRRVGRRIYQVPVPLERKKQYKLALKWITGLARNKKKTGAVGIGGTAEILATELSNTVFLKRSECLKKKKELYDLVVKNRAYSHYRWI